MFGNLGRVALASAGSSFAALRTGSVASRPQCVSKLQIFGNLGHLGELSEVSEVSEVAKENPGVNPAYPCSRGGDKLPITNSQITNYQRPFTQPSGGRALPILPQYRRDIKTVEMENESPFMSLE
jgi:hypothetical protein